MKNLFQTIILILVGHSLFAQGKNGTETNVFIKKLSLENGIALNYGTLEFRQPYAELHKPTLIKLTSDSSASVRCVSFIALIVRNEPEVREIFRKHLQDTVSLYTYYFPSSLVELNKVNEVMLDQLHPIGSISDYRFFS